MIGVFDSGVGGLTVLKRLRETLPEENFLYFGDHAYSPYGPRAPDDIYLLTRRGVTALFEAGCRLVVVACNTASAVALRRMQQEWLPRAYPDRNVLGVFVPVVEAVTGRGWHSPNDSPYAPPRVPRTVGFFATRRTVESNAFPNEVKRLARHIYVVQQACPRLAEAIEEGWADDDLAAGIARYVGSLMSKCGRSPPDLVVLGCTHYPLVQHHFEKALPYGTPVLDPAQAVADGLKEYLKRHREYRKKRDEAPGVAFLTSGDPARAGAAAQRFYGEACDFRHPDLPEGVKPSSAPVAAPVAAPVDGNAAASQSGNAAETDGDADVEIRQVPRGDGGTSEPALGTEEVPDPAGQDSATRNPAMQKKEGER